MKKNEFLPALNPCICSGETNYLTNHKAQNAAKLHETYKGQNPRKPVSRNKRPTHCHPEKVEGSHWVSGQVGGFFGYAQNDTLVGRFFGYAKLRSE